MDGFWAFFKDVTHRSIDTMTEDPNLFGLPTITEELPFPKRARVEFTPHIRDDGTISLSHALSSIYDRDANLDDLAVFCYDPVPPLATDVQASMFS